MIQRLYIQGWSLYSIGWKFPQIYVHTNKFEKAEETSGHTRNPVSVSSRLSLLHLQVECFTI